MTGTVNELIDMCEEYWHINGRLPTANEVFARLGQKEAWYSKQLSDSKIIEKLNNRGITVTKQHGLSAQQLTLANMMLDITDTRSDAKKISDCGITSYQYRAWLKDPAFNEYMRTRTEQMFSENMHEAHLALMDNVRRGDMTAIKQFYEMTGRWSGKTVDQLNVNYLLMKILEAIQKHVKDPVAIQAVAEELEQLAVGTMGTPGPAAAIPGMQYQRPALSALTSGVDSISGVDNNGRTIVEV